MERENVPGILRCFGCNQAFYFQHLLGFLGSEFSDGWVLAPNERSISSARATLISVYPPIEVKCR